MDEFDEDDEFDDFERMDEAHDFDVGIRVLRWAASFSLGMFLLSVLFTGWGIWEDTGSGTPSMWVPGSLSGDEPETVDRVRAVIVGTAQTGSAFYLLAFVIAYVALLHFTLPATGALDEGE